MELKTNIGDFMRNPFKRTPKPKPEPKKLFFPKDKIRRILKLYDDYTSAPQNCNTLKRYDFWTAVVEIFPEVEFGYWQVQLKDGVNLYVVEREEERK